MNFKNGNYKVVAVIPAKGSSERIKSKNLRLIDGEPLVFRALRRCIESNFFDEVWLDTDSDEIIEVCSDLECKVLKREKKFATNNTDGNGLLLNEIKNIQSDYYCQILCTSPFLDINSVKHAFEKLITSDVYDSIVAGSTDSFYQWIDKKPSYDLQNIPNSKDLVSTFNESMGVYIIKKDIALKFKRRIGNNPFFLELNPVELIDVNYEKDLKLANLISGGIREEENSKLRLLSRILSSALISDVMDSIGYTNNFINHDLTANISNKKLFGRVKTLSMRNIKNGENVEDIYDSHNIYENIKINDLLVVNNKTNFSFFGEINSSFAIRSGASGAIIFGPTRDIEATRSFDFPVYYKSLCSKDIRGRGMLESFNKKININGVDISPNQLAFIDNEGMVIIPKEIEDRVIKTSVEKISSESSIIKGISEGLNNRNLMKDFGHF